MLLKVQERFMKDDQNCLAVVKKRKIYTYSGQDMCIEPSTDTVQTMEVLDGTPPQTKAA